MGAMSLQAHLFQHEREPLQGCRIVTADSMAAQLILAGPESQYGRTFVLQVAHNQETICSGQSEALAIPRRERPSPRTR